MSDYISYNEMRNFGRELRESLTETILTHTRHHSNVGLIGFENIPLILQLYRINIYRDRDSIYL